MGSGASKQREIPRFTKFIPREPANEKFDIPDEVSSYPPPCCPLRPNSDIYNPSHNEIIYEHVLKTKRNYEHSWDKLVNYLISPYRQDVEKVRAIFTWLGAQDLRSRIFVPSLDVDNLEEVSPRGYLKLLKQRRASYASMFALLCRRARIKCVIIRGISKGNDYEVGQKEVEYLRDCWVAVYIDGWRLIHPLWAYKALMSYKKLSSKCVEKDSARAGKHKDTEDMFNEHYFLIEPTDLISVCLPDDQRWQLITKPVTMKTWISIPLILMGSQRDGLRLAKGFASEIKAKRSSCGLVIREPNNTDCEHQLSYDLFFKHDNFTSRFKDKIVLKNYVLMSRDNTKRRWAFEIRMPVPGRYRITVYGGTSSEKSLPCVLDVAFRCKKPSKTVKPYPANPSIGYGPVRKTVLSGLIEPSHSNGMLFLETKQTTHITFKLTKSLKAKAKLYDEDSHKVKSFKWFTCTINKVASGELLDVVVCLQKDGEYALKIYVKDKDTKDRDWENACNYYLSTSRPRPNGTLVEDKGYKTERDLDAEKAKEEAKKGTDMHEIKSIVQKSEEPANHYEADGSFGKATVKMEYLEHVKALKEAISLQNYEKLTKVIKRVELSDCAEKLEKLLAEARAEQTKALEVAVTDIVKGTGESTVAFGVLKSALLVIGESQENTETWNGISEIFENRGTGDVLKVLEQQEMKEGSDDALYKARLIIDSYIYNMENVKTESNALAEVLRRVKTITDKHKIKNETESVTE